MHNAQTSKECWDRLADQYEGEGDQWIIYLLEKLLMTPFLNTEPMQVQLNTLTMTAQQLKVAGLSVDNKLLAFLIVLCLPDSYAMLKTVLSSLDSTKATSKGMTSQILAEECRHIHSSGGDIVAFYAKAKKGNKPQHPERNKKKCLHCKKKGHEKSECQKLQKEKKEEAAKAGNAKPLTSSTNSGTTSAKVTVTTTAPKDDIVCLFRAITVPTATPQSDPSDLFRSDVTTDPQPRTEHVCMAHEEHTSPELTEEWIMDSGVSWIMCSHRDWFTSYSPLVSPINVVLANDSAIPVTGVGRIPVRMHTNNEWQPAVLQDILYVPTLHGILLSISQLAHRGTEMCFVGEGCQILDQRKDLACEGDLCGSLYFMGIHTTCPESAWIATIEEFPDEGKELPELALAACSNTSKAPLEVWHRCLGHLNEDMILTMLKKGLVKGMEITGGKKLPSPCEPCLKGKQTRAEIQKATNMCAGTVLERISLDVCRKLSTKSHQGYKYFVTWIDDKSRKTFIMGMRNKSEALQHLKALIP